MYLPAHFKEERPEVLHALLRAHPLGLLITQDASSEMSANSVPFVLDADPAGGPGVLRAHVARANP
ncbi:MAG: FMN-binding negative transcriptional regulator, partial [Rhizobiales bacterium]|nr:FMN-binding negative transcriptional regulator [Rhizobacter sp.]